MKEDWAEVPRRDFLKAIATAGAVGAMPLVGAGCAAPCEAKGRVVIVGAGAAGMSLAARLAGRLRNAEILLVDPAERQFYQPGFTLIAAGLYDPDEVWRPQADFVPRTVKWVRKAVTGVRPEAKKLTLAGGEQLDYDFLVLVPGIQLNWGGIQGISQATLGEGNAHSVYDWQGAVKLRDAMRNFATTGGRGIFCDTWTKLKCGGAPKKICLLTEHQLRLKGTRDRAAFQYFTASKELYDVPFYTPRLEEIFRERNVPVSLRVKLVGVDLGAKRATFERTEVVGTKTVTDRLTGETKKQEILRPTTFTEEYDFLHFAPPQSSPDFVRDSGLGWQEGKLAREAWVEVDRETLVHRRYSSIISFGDVAGIPTSKTSAAVRMQLPIAEENLVALLEGREPVAKYDGYAACPIVTDYGHVLLCEFDYDKKPRTSFPFTLLDTSKELRSAWWLKTRFLKPFFFHGMLRGRV